METLDAQGPADDPLVGTVLAGRYRIDAILGRGGMGAVYRAQHLTLDRPVAIKVLRTDLGDDDSWSKRFDREALSASKLDHPNCVQIVDFGTAEDGLKYLVMQFLEGRELRHLATGSLAPERAVALMIQILSALEHAHKRGMVHRDLKPENIFIVSDDRGREVPKLVDFGIVKLTADTGTEEKLTRAGIAFGTPRYMSPEQVAGGLLDGRTDLYAAGVILYELLAGVLPFDADDPSVLLRMHLVAPPPPLPAHVPAPLAAVVAWALNKRPAERPQNATEMREALEAAWEACNTADANTSSPSKSTAEGVSEAVSPKPVQHTILAAPAHDPRSTRLLWLFMGVPATLAIVLYGVCFVRSCSEEAEEPASSESVAPPSGAGEGAHDSDRQGSRPSTTAGSAAKATSDRAGPHPTPTNRARKKGP